MKIKKFILKNRELILLFILFGLILISRIYFLGSSLWHDDAFNFVDKAVDLAVNGIYTNAHSTGYPSFIALLALALSIGKVITGHVSIIYVPNLTVAFFGSILTLPVYFFSKRLVGNIYFAGLTTLLVLANPIIWRWSEVAMSDIFVLALVFGSLMLYLQYIHSNKKSSLYISGALLYIALLSRMLYVLILIPLAIYWWLKSENRKQQGVHISISWVLTGVITLATYFLINNYSLSVLTTSYGTVFPSASEFFSTIWIILKSPGIILSACGILGLIFMYKKNRAMFYLCVTTVLTFTVYLSAWYRNGWFDIERYSMLITVILIISAGYLLVINTATRSVLGIAVLITGFLFFKGMGQDIQLYRAYIPSDHVFDDYQIKVALLDQQRRVDSDVRIYNDLASYIKDGDIVFRWSNDWIIPKLLLTGAHLKNKATLVSIDSYDELRMRLEEYSDSNIFLLRGTYDAYLELGDTVPELESVTVNNRTIIYFVPARENNNS